MGNFTLKGLIFMLFPLKKLFIDKIDEKKNNIFCNTVLFLWLIFRDLLLLKLFNPMCFRFEMTYLFLN